MKKKLLSVILIILSLCVPSKALVNVDFNARGPSATMSGAAVLGSAGDTWNGIEWANLGGVVTTANSLLDSTNAPSPVSISLTADWNDVTGDVPGPAATDAVDLMRDGLTHSAFVTPAGSAILTISGLPNNSPYTLVLYGAGDGAAHGSIFSVAGSTEVTGTTIGSSATPLASPQHYVTFTGNTSATGEIDVTWTGVEGQWSGFNGFQIIENSSPLPFRITSIEGDFTTGIVDLVWNSQSMGPQFDVLSSAGLALPLDQWNVEQASIPNAGNTTSTQLSGITGDRRFFVVRGTPSPVSSGLTLVPFPTSVQVPGSSKFRFNSSSRILFETRSTSRSIENSLEPLAHVLAGELELVTGTLPAVIDLSTTGTPQSNDIVLRFDTPNGTFAATEDLEDQSYTLNSNADGLEIRSAYYKGVAYGTATLIQALKEDGSGFYVPAMDISDSPEAAYRAIMLDIARQVHSIGVIKDVVRMARLFKIRYLHLHLTDDQNFTFPVV